ncbi:bifunctional lysylphosphatidylglycerol flippase/synthetase MprF [Xanthomonas sp. XNM01]|nr:bifunctional lysylphosphatidylglycerol flippase/synthetase MprF [Xanthomonas sp. XNM01]MBD9369407.1 bifunctional lysylphosphatidylglycerol flippase/synthetase MprF [Xanthomonas sp. XNM01]
MSQQTSVQEATDADAGWLARLVRWRRWWIGAGLAVLLVLLGLALHGLWRELSYAQIVAAVRATPMRDIALALLATLISFLALSGYDHASLRYVGVRLPYRTVAQTSFIAYALANTIGLGVFTGGAVRMRLYGAAGVEAGQVSRAIAFNAAAFGLGISAVGAFGVLVNATAMAAMAGVPAWLLQGASLLVLALLGGLLLARGRTWRSRRMARWVERLPGRRLMLEQLLWSALDILATGAVLWLLLPDGAIGFPVFIGFYAAALVLAVISHVPGGLGVFEATMLLALGGRVPAETVAGALVLYRLIYYVLPLLLALGLLLLHEARHGIAAPVAQAAGALLPRLLAAYTLVVAVVLLVSGVTPAGLEATAVLATWAPLPLVEAAHFLSSVAGLALLFVARGMLLRLDAAWWAGLLLAGAGLLLALPKGLAWSEVAILAPLVLALLLSHRRFDRRASLLAVPFSGGWLLAMGAIVAALVVLLFFAYQDVEYGRQLWWQFEFDADAPRSLRALVAIALLALAVALYQLLRPSQPVLEPAGAEELARAAAIVRAQDDADAGLALVGDKRFLFSDDGRALLAYARRGRSWVALSDPVGPEPQCRELVWRFLAMVHEGGGRGGFYQVRPDRLPAYLDAGLRLLKLGEYAYVPLAGFSLEGKARSGLRYSVKRAEREGLDFELVPPAGVPAVLEEMRAVSDAWLAAHRTAEKRFSVGAFVDAYVGRQTVALVRQHGCLVAFATVLDTDTRSEASIDLMRHVSPMPYGTMDFLFVRLMLHFAQAGHARFGLGMAPLSGMASGPLAPYWHRAGRLLFAHGEEFYNFRGLRAFKEKFEPQWEPRYLATPGGVAPLLVLADIAALIAGGLKGVIAK